MKKLFKRLGKKCVAIILKKYNQVPCRVTGILNREPKPFIFEHNDFIRVSSLALIANEIYEKNISGCVAELGVFQGNFARIINKAFPDRKLYLFDTFEGFDKKDIEIELEKNYSDCKEGHFSQTNVELVLEKMENKQNCIIKKGYFPDTAIGINETFSFVSIDVDLYQPIYKGLHYFYERLNNGGYIMIHDYHSKKYTGVKVALRKFSEEKKAAYFPISDNVGSVVVMKP